LGGKNGVVQLWNLTSQQELTNLSEYKGGGFIGPMAFSPDGKRLAISSGQEQDTRIWDLASRQALLTLPTGESPSWTTFSPDGKLLASGNCSGTLSVWDATTGELKFRVQAHSACITPLVFSPDGTRIATTSSDRTTRIWDMTNGKELLTLPMGGLLGPTNLAFSPDGKILLASVDYSNAGDFDTRIFLLDSQDLVALAKTRVTRTLTPEECQKYLHVEQCPAEP
jgi:WD40 repeat protein